VNFDYFSPVFSAYALFLLLFSLLPSVFQWPLFLTPFSFLSFHFSFSSFPLLFNQFTFLYLFHLGFSLIYFPHVQAFFVLWLTLLPFFCSLIAKDSLLLTSFSTLKQTLSDSF